MRRIESQCKRHLVPLALAIALGGCGQPPALIMDDSTNYRKHEQLIMVPEKSSESTNLGIWMDMEGGG
jgi:hypothetical protein